MYIGGLFVMEKPCDCGAPFAETGVIDDAGNVTVTLWEGVTDTYEQSVVLFNNRRPGDNPDDLNMVCTRCGKNAVSC